MTDFKLPLESHLRDLILKVQDELAKLKKQPRETHSQIEAIAIWEACLIRFISECLIMIERNIDYRKEFNEN